MAANGQNNNAQERSFVIPEPEKLQASIRAIVQSTGDDLAQAAQQLTQNVAPGDGREAKKSGSAEEALSVFWSAFIAVAKSLSPTPEDDGRRKRLVDLVARIKTIQDGDLEPWGGDGTVRPKLWNDLPFLGPQMREAWNCESSYNAGERGDISNSLTAGGDGTINCILTVSPESPEEAEQSLGLVSFAALLTGEDVASYANYAVWDFRDSVEGRGSDPGTSVVDAFSKDSGAPLKLRRCLLWVQGAGAALHQNPASLILSTPGGHLWEKNPAVEDKKDGEARWAFWKAQAEALSAVNNSLDSQVRQLAGQLRTKMDEVEKAR